MWYRLAGYGENKKGACVAGGGMSIAPRIDPSSTRNANCVLSPLARRPSGGFRVSVLYELSEIKKDAGGARRPRVIRSFLLGILVAEGETGQARGDGFV